MTKLLSLLLVLVIFLEQLCSCSEFSDSVSLTPETSSKKNKVNLFRKRSDRSETSLLMGKIKIDGFVEKFDRIPVDVFFCGFKDQLMTAIESFDGEVSNWALFARMLTDHFERAGELGNDSFKITLFTFLSRFWMNESDLEPAIRDEMAPELIRLLQLSTLAGSLGIRGMLIALKCKNFDEYLMKYCQGVYNRGVSEGGPEPALQRTSHSSS